jgi:hypothetical protein
MLARITGPRKQRNSSVFHPQFPLPQSFPHFSPRSQTRHLPPFPTSCLPQIPQNTDLHDPNSRKSSNVNNSIVRNSRIIHRPTKSFRPPNPFKISSPPIQSLIFAPPTIPNHFPINNHQPPPNPKLRTRNALLLTRQNLPSLLGINYQEVEPPPLLSTNHDSHFLFFQRQDGHFRV